jgi:hypothetical protein
VDHERAAPADIQVSQRRTVCLAAWVPALKGTTVANSRVLCPRASSGSPSLRSRSDRLQRIEEALVVTTGAPREPGRPAWVVLGVNAVEARGSAPRDGPANDMRGRVSRLCAQVPSSLCCAAGAHRAFDFPRCAPLLREPARRRAPIQVTPVEPALTTPRAPLKSPPGFPGGRSTSQ